ncbi:MAG: hypothetical protein QOJ11_3083, partial [Frankiales bacterium]|nr:hypothetical protein [Frankiales bacterium]
MVLSGLRRREKSPPGSGGLRVDFAAHAASLGATVFDVPDKAGLDNLMLNDEVIPLDGAPPIVTQVSVGRAAAGRPPHRS